MGTARELTGRSFRRLFQPFQQEQKFEVEGALGNGPGNLSPAECLARSELARLPERRKRGDGASAVVPGMP